MMAKIPITVIVPVKNEEVNLPYCLQLLGDFEQIIVVDSNSTDRTITIAEEYGAEVYQFNWDGRFPKKRNWALRNLFIRNEWVLFIDADEYITDAFRSEIQQKIKDPEVNGYWVTYRNYFMGKLLKHGYPFIKLPLTRVGTGEYEMIEEDSWSQLDMEVHEHLIISGKTGHLNATITHNDYKGLDHYISRHNAYSSWEAKRFLGLQKGGFKTLTFNQKLKYRLMKSGFLPPLYFIGVYLFKLGFLDGLPGYYIAKYKAHYFFQIQTKITEILATNKN